MLNCTTKQRGYLHAVFAHSPGLPIGFGLALLLGNVTDVVIAHSILIVSIICYVSINRNVERINRILLDNGELERFSFLSNAFLVNANLAFIYFGIYGAVASGDGPFTLWDVFALCLIIAPPLLAIFWILENSKALMALLRMLDKK